MRNDPWLLKTFTIHLWQPYVENNCKCGFWKSGIEWVFAVWKYVLGGNLKLVNSHHLWPREQSLARPVKETQGQKQLMSSVSSKAWAKHWRCTLKHMETGACHTGKDGFKKGTTCKLQAFHQSFTCQFRSLPATDTLGLLKVALSKVRTLQTRPVNFNSGHISWTLFSEAQLRAHQRLRLLCVQKESHKVGQIY